MHAVDISVFVCPVVVGESIELISLYLNNECALQFSYYISMNIPIHSNIKINSTILKEYNDMPKGDLAHFEILVLFLN